MVDRVISWAEYHQSIEKLAYQIHSSGWEFNQILCLAKGGLRIGDILARIFDQPLAILNVSSYGASSNREQGRIHFAEQLTNFGTLGDLLLLVDDLVDTGKSIIHTVNWLEKYATHLTDTRTAVLWYKANSHYKPDYYVEFMADNPWIQQPFEHYEKGYFANFE